MVQFCMFVLLPQNKCECDKIAAAKRAAQEVSKKSIFPSLICVLTVIIRQCVNVIELVRVTSSDVTRKNISYN